MNFNNLCKDVNFEEVIPGTRKNSEIIILDFAQIPKYFPPQKNIRLFFKESVKKGIDPRSPASRQEFNDLFLKHSGKRALIGRYGEDRLEMLRGSSIWREGRTIHMGIDIFTKKCESVYCPLDGNIIIVNREPDSHSYGFYAIIEHTIKGITFCTFYDHLSSKLPKTGLIKKGEKIGWLGDFINNENGGWSRHLHFQLLLEKPQEKEAPQGYSTKSNFEKSSRVFPDPNIILQLSALSSF